MAYYPQQPPENPNELQWYIYEELKRIQDELLNPEVETVRLTELHAEPARPRDSMVVYADGSDWNPGSGEGFYGRENGAWVKL